MCKLHNDFKLERLRGVFCLLFSIPERAVLSLDNYLLIRSHKKRLKSKFDGKIDTNFRAVDRRVEGKKRDGTVKVPVYRFSSAFY